MKIVREALLLIGFFVLIGVAVYWWNPEPNVQEGLFSLETEEEIGELILNQQVVTEIDFQEPQSHVDSCFFAITQRFSKKMESSKYSYHFYLVNTESVNAFALPGGNIVVYKGLLQDAEGLEEVAAVMAHEIGHIEESHVTERLAKEIGVTAVVTLLSGGDPNLITQLINTFLSNQYDQIQETEADEFAVRLLIEAEIHPKHMLSFFERLQEEYKGLDEDFEWMMSHPSMKKRMESVKDEMKRVGVGHVKPFSITLNKKALQEVS